MPIVVTLTSEEKLDLFTNARDLETMRVWWVKKLATLGHSAKEVTTKQLMYPEGKGWSNHFEVTYSNVDRDKAVQEVFNNWEKVVPAPGRFNMNAHTKQMMDVYNAHFAPVENGRKKVESINCMPCVKKVISFFTALKSKYDKSGV